MIDIDSLKKLLGAFGVQYTQEVGIDGNTFVTCMQGDQKVAGDCNYEFDFGFTPDGEFIEMGAYEA